ncbi:MAG: glycosyltransferase family 1 protein [Roseburia faecis]|nr:glycosyltransferase family 1 protein [Roseburia faecis]
MMEPIRVLHNIASLHFGGSQAFVMNIYHNIDRTKVQFDFIVTPEERKGLYDQVERLGGRIYVCPKYKGKNHISYCAWWNEFFETHPEYHVIHGHVRSTAAIYLKIAKKHGLVTILHSHSTSNGCGFSGLVKNVMQLPIRHIADYLFACSDKAGLWLFGEKATRQSNYRMIPNGVDLERFAFNKAEREEMRRQLGIRDGEFIIGHIGRFTEPKNHKFLVDLFSEYHKHNPSSRLLMVGDGELYEPVKKQCKDLGISAFVIMPGSRTNTEDFYQAMDIFVFPSLWEGLPVSVVEAQANGLTCLISDVITRDVDLTDLISYLPLNNKQIWIVDIDKAIIRGHKAISEDNKLKIQPFDSKRVSMELQAFYLELDKKGRP